MPNAGEQLRADVLDNRARFILREPTLDAEVNRVLAGTFAAWVASIRRALGKRTIGPSELAEIIRRASILRDVGRITDAALASVRALVSKRAAATFRTEVYRHAQTMEASAGTSFDGLNAAAVATAFHDAIPGIMGTVSFAGASRAAHRAMQQDVAEAIAEGWDLNRLVRKWDGGAGAGRITSDARILARTAAIAASAKAQLYAYGQDPEVTAVQWEATFDSRTCPLCGSLHGQIFPKAHAPPLPAHYQCRCVWLPIFKDASLNADLDNAEPYPAPAPAQFLQNDRKFETWLDGQDESIQRDFFGSELKYEAWNDGKLDLADMIRDDGTTKNDREVADAVGDIGWVEGVLDRNRTTSRPPPRVASEPVAETPEAFVSPNEENLDLERAIANMGTGAYHRARAEIEALAAQASGEAKVEDTLGVWSDGAEQSYHVVMPGATFAEARRATAEMALKTRQKGAVVVRPGADGEGSVFRIETSVPYADVRKVEDAVRAVDPGMFRSVVRGPDGRAVIIVLDPAARPEASPLIPNLNAIAEALDAQVTHTPAHVEFIGAETRDAAAAEYTRILAEPLPPRTAGTIPIRDRGRGGPEEAAAPAAIAAGPQQWPPGYNPEEYPLLPARGKDGKIRVDGRIVTKNIDNQGSISASLDDWDVLPGLREVQVWDPEIKPQPYSVQEAARLKDLAARIKASGRISPLIIVVNKDGPYILEGGHRFDALKLLGAKSFPAMVVIDRGDAEGIPREDAAVAAGPAPGVPPEDVKWWSSYAQGWTFKSEQEARDWVFDRAQHADKATPFPSGKEANQQLADTIPLYKSGKSWKIGQRIRRSTGFKWDQVDIRPNSVEGLSTAGFVNPFDSPQLGAVEMTPIRKLHFTDSNETAADKEPVARELAAQIKENGWFKPIVIDSGGAIIDGHHRMLAAQILKMKRVPTQTLTTEDEREYEARAFAPGKSAPAPGAPDTPPETAPRRWVEKAPGLPDDTLNYWKAKGGGTIPPERLKLHDQIVEKYLGDAKPEEHPTAYVTMGGPASGKSSMLAAFGIDPKKFALVDADAVKGELPEYREAIAASARNAANIAHEESSFVAKRVRDEAIASHKSFIYDQLGKNRETFLIGLQNLKDAGYKVVLLMPDVDTDVAHKRMLARAEVTGRWVPEDVFRAAYEKVTKNFLPAASIADEAYLYDNRGDAPRLVYSKIAGTETAQDPQFVADFARRNGWVGPPPGSVPVATGPGPAARAEIEVLLAKVRAPREPTTADKERFAAANRVLFAPETQKSAEKLAAAQLEWISARQLAQSNARDASSIQGDMNSLATTLDKDGAELSEGITEEIINKIQDLTRELVIARGETPGAVRNQIIEKVLAVPKPIALPKPVISDALKGERLGEASYRGAAAEFSRMIADRDVSKGKAHIWVQSAAEQQGPLAGRGSFDYYTWNLTMGAMNSNRTTVHELGHWLEAADYKAKELAGRFLDRRTAGETPQKLADLVPGGGYQPDEMVRPDKFISPYVGKVYGDRSTEVLSMGVEQMWSDPAGFAKADPEHFDFTLAIMRGNYAAAERIAGPAVAAAATTTGGTPASGPTHDPKKAAEKFVKTVEGWGFINPFNSHEIVVDERAAVDVRASSDGVYLSTIRALEKNQGSGTAVMTKLLDLADKLNVPLTGAAVPFGTGGLPKKKLIAWYRKLGFTIEGDDNLRYTPGSRG